MDFLGSGGFTDAGHFQIRAEVVGGRTLVELWVPIDHPAAGRPYAQGNASITLEGVHQLSSRDFILA